MKTQEVFTNFFFMSNHPDALVLTPEDRRINVFQCPHAPRERAYYDHIYGSERGPGVAALHAWLKARDLSRFNWQRSIETPARQAMIDGNMTETEELFRDLLLDPPAPVMTFPQIVEAMGGLSERGAFETSIDEGQLRKLLQHKCRQYKKLQLGGRGSKTVRPWVLVQDFCGDTDVVKNLINDLGASDA